MGKVLAVLLVAVAVLALPQVLLAEEGRKPGFDPQKIYAKVKEADKNNDGKLSKDEVDERMRPHFDKVDLDKSGYLEKREIRRAVRGMMIFVRLMQADKDKDHKLSKEEAPERMKAHFDKIDKNSDGFVDHGELRPVVERILKHARDGGKGRDHGKARDGGKGRDDSKSHSERRKKFFERLKAADKNGDGKLSKEEAPGRMKEHFDKIDANSDGQIDKEELKAAIKARMKKLREKRAEGSEKK